MKSTREDRVTATECLFDAGGELRGVAHARERIVAAIERARADGAAAALTDPRLVLDAAEKLLRSCIEGDVEYRIHLSMDCVSFELSRLTGPIGTPFAVELSSLTELYFADEEEARRG